MIFPISDRDLVLGFSSALALAMICGEGAEYIEIPAQELFKDLERAQVDFGYNFGQDDAVIYESGELQLLIEQASHDTILDIPSRFDFTELGEVGRLTEALGEICPHDDIISIIRDKTLGILICFPVSEIEAHPELLAHLHEVAVAANDVEAVTLMPFRDGAEIIDDDFETYAHWVKTPKLQKHDHPPILR